MSIVFQLFNSVRVSSVLLTIQFFSVLFVLIWKRVTGVSFQLLGSYWTGFQPGFANSPGNHLFWLGSSGKTPVIVLLVSALSGSCFKGSDVVTSPYCLALQMGQVGL